MLIKSKRNWIYPLSALWLLSISIMITWWGYLIFRLGNDPSFLGQDKIRSLIFWEGLAFIIILALLSCSLFYIYITERKKSTSIQSFFATLGHELKTPLASMRLQSQVIQDLAEESGHQQINKLSHRLTEDTLKFENELERALGLSRLFRRASFNQTSISLENFINEQVRSFTQMEIQITGKASSPILFDEYSLKLILRNLFENTLRHTPHKKTSLKIQESEEQIALFYSDQGEFKGDSKRLGDLFYKHNSPKGTGIGLFLIRELMVKNEGRIQIKDKPNFSVKLIFKKSI